MRTKLTLAVALISSPVIAQESEELSSDSEQSCPRCVKLLRADLSEIRSTIASMNKQVEQLAADLKKRPAPKRAAVTFDMPTPASGSSSEWNSWTALFVNNQVSGDRTLTSVSNAACAKVGYGKGFPLLTNRVSNVRYVTRVICSD